jgi:hypothetical protein
MKKRIFSFLAMMFLFANATSMAPTSVEIDNYEDQASCFEEGNYYAQWWGAVNNASSFQQLEMALAYTEACERARAPKWQMT